MSEQTCHFFNGLKRCASKNAFVRCNKKSGKAVRFYRKRKSGGKIPHIRPSPKQNTSESQFSCIIQELVSYALAESSGISKITPVRSKNRRITVSVFLSTLQSIALLLKSFRLRFHCYTLSYIALPRAGPCQDSQFPQSQLCRVILYSTFTRKPTFENIYLVAGCCATALLSSSGRHSQKSARCPIYYIKYLQC